METTAAPEAPLEAAWRRWSDEPDFRTRVQAVLRHAWAPSVVGVRRLWDYDSVVTGAALALHLAEQEGVMTPASEPRPWINTALCRRMPEVNGDDWCVAHGMPYPHDV